METQRVCSECAKPLDQDTPEGLCPACRLKAGLGTGASVEPSGQSTDTSGAFVAPSPQELQHAFPQLEILELVGQGGMGAVYKVRQTALDRIVALKILPPGIGADPAFTERFAREAKALAKLNHPGIITLYEFGQSGELFYFLMEFVNGVTLRHIMRAERLSPRDALAIVPQVCDAIQYAHDQGIVHRDIKPENILFDRLGRVKVADFGLAILIEAHESFNANEAPDASAGQVGRGHVIGTSQYMAPEQSASSAVDHRADIYSLGVVLYQMLTGELPGQPIEPPSSRVVIDVRLDEVVLRALQREPERRYQQASMITSAIETINRSHAPLAAEQPASEKPDGPPIRTRSSMRLPWLAIVLAVALVPLFFRAWIFSPAPNPLFWLIMLAASLSETTVLGWLAWSQLRQPGRRLYGTGLALLGALLLLGTGVTVNRPMPSPSFPTRTPPLPRSSISIPVIQKLQQGEVELVAVTAWPLGDEPSWWTPDGQPYAGPAIPRFSVGHSTKEGHIDRVFAITIRGREWGEHVMCMTDPPDSNFPKPRQALTSGGYDGSGVTTLTVDATLPNGVATANFSVGVPTGTWRVAGSSLQDHTAPEDISPDRPVSFLPPKDTPEGLQVGALHSFGDSLTWLTAVTLDGKQHDMMSVVASGDWTPSYEKLTLLSVIAPELHANDIKEIQLLVRPFEWVTFRGVALYPAPSKTPLPVHLRPVSEMPEDLRLAADSVELIAVTYHPEKPIQTWWDRNGQRYTGPAIAIDGGGDPGGLGRTVRALVVRLAGLPADASRPRWRIEKAESNTEGRVLQAGQVADDLRCVVTSVPDSLPSTDVRCGIATGTWETVAAQVPTKEFVQSYNDTFGSWALSLAKPRQTSRGTEVCLEHTLKGCDTRVVAVTIDGQLHASSEIPGYHPISDATSATFLRLALKNIKELRFQRRPYRWIEFKDVAMNPTAP